MKLANTLYNIVIIFTSTFLLVESNSKVEYNKNFLR